MLLVTYIMSDQKLKWHRHRHNYTIFDCWFVETPCLNMILTISFCCLNVSISFFRWIWIRITCCCAALFYLASHPISKIIKSMIYDIVQYHDIYQNVPREKEGLLCCIRWRLVIDSRALVPCDYPPSTSNIANMWLSTIYHPQI